MDSFLAAGLPPELASLLADVQQEEPAEVARRTITLIGKTPSPDQQAEIGRHALNFLKPRLEPSQIETVERALEVMDKFPHFPRPRAGVALKALKALC
ncbi:MAG: hypothetical protein AB7S38_35580 [Vulcanimicrobiota bacterium]